MHAAHARPRRAVLAPPSGSIRTLRSRPGGSSDAAYVLRFPTTPRPVREVFVLASRAACFAGERGWYWGAGEWARWSGGRYKPHCVFPRSGPRVAVVHDGHLEGVPRQGKLYRFGLVVDGCVGGLVLTLCVDLASPWGGGGGEKTFHRRVYHSAVANARF